MTASKNGNGKRALKHYRPQKMNANKHTPFGLSKLRESIGADGIIGAITVARDGESFDGSARLETLAEAMPSVKIVEVETDGNTLIVNKRKDIPNANSPRAKRLGVAANVIAKLDYNPDGEILAALAAEDKMIADYVKAERDSLRAVQTYAAAPGNHNLNLSDQWLILVICEDENHQSKLLSRFMQENLKCRALIS